MIKHLLSASVVLAAAPLFAQSPGAPPSGGPGPGGPVMSGHGMPGGFGMRQTVTNAPYSATFTTTSTEKLQDGTVLTRTETRVATRDSLGRTREEITLPARRGADKPHTSIVILDPVTRTVTRLDAERKTATVFSIPQPRQGEGRGGPAGPPPAGDQARADRPHHDDKAVVKADLGSKTIDGVVATGTRTTRTIPANEMGNSAPIVSTHEEWFSPDLKIQLTRTDSDPFRGSHTTTVSGLTKAEPAAALFAVPAGYTVQQSPNFGRRGPGGLRHEGGAPPPPPAGM